MDSGAAVSLVNEHALTADNHIIVGRRTKIYKGAGNEILPLGDNLVDIKVKIPDVGFLTIKNAVVCKGQRHNSKILMGTPDIQRLGLILNYNNNTIQITKGSLKNKSFKMPTIRSLLKEDRAFEIIDAYRSSNELSESIQSMFETLICTVSDDEPVIEKSAVKNKTDLLKANPDKNEPILNNSYLSWRHIK